MCLLSQTHQKPRRGNILVFTAFMMVLLLAVIAFAVLVTAGRYLVTIPAANALNILSGTGAISVLFALVSWLFMRRRRSWSARLTVASAAALGGWSTWLAWDRYQLLEWTTAAALAVLLLVYLFVAGRWISRAESR